MVYPTERHLILLYRSNYHVALMNITEMVMEFTCYPSMSVIHNIESMCLSKI